MSCSELPIIRLELSSNLLVPQAFTCRILVVSNLRSENKGTWFDQLLLLLLFI